MTPLDTIPPVVQISTPRTGTVVSPGERLTLVVTAGDNSGVSPLVLMLVNQVGVCGVLTVPPYTCDWTVPSGKQFELRAVAIDTAGNSALSDAVRLKSKDRSAEDAPEVPPTHQTPHGWSFGW